MLKLSFLKNGLNEDDDLNYRNSISGNNTTMNQQNKDLNYPDFN